MMYLGFLPSYVQQHTAGEKYAIETLRELQEDWLLINTVAIKSIAANQEWIEQLTQEAGDNIISLLEYRKTAAPAIEYQTSLLEFTASNP